MNGKEPPVQETPKRKSKTWRLVAIVAVVVLAFLGVSIYVAYQSAQCGFVGCGPVDEPVILNAYASQSSVRTNCGIVTQGYPQAVVCDVTLSGGVSGTIVLNLTSKGGDSQVAFGTYSSSQDIRFTSTYPCLYSSTPPDYNALRCPVSGAGSTYRFNFTVSENVAASEQVVLVIVVTKTCCWP